MKIMVLGAAGMAGHTIALYFQEKGYDVTGFVARPVPFVKYVLGNALDSAALKDIISKEKSDVIINCIGILNKNAEDNPAEAIFLNSFLPHYLVKLTEDTSTKIIHMSTDCVFAGNTGPYSEDSFPDGRSVYDRTKALGELNDAKNLTFRNSIIGPDVKATGIGLFNWFMKQKGHIKGYTKAIWTGVTTLTLAKAMERAIEDNLTGLYNLVNNVSISKYDLLKLFNKYFRDNKLVIEPSGDVCLDKTLLCTRTDFSYAVPSYEEMVSEMKEWIEKTEQNYGNDTGKY